MRLDQGQAGADLELQIAAIILDELGLTDLDHPLPAFAGQTVAKRVLEFQGLAVEKRQELTRQTLAELREVLPDQAQSLESQLGCSALP